MGNIDRQTADKLFEISKRFACEDTPEVKQMILDINAQVPEEAKRLHRDSIIIDQCNFSFESYFLEFSRIRHYGPCHNKYGYKGRCRRCDSLFGG